METYISNIEKVLKQCNITEGVILNTTTALQDLTYNQQVIDNTQLIDVLRNSDLVNAVIVDETILAKEYVNELIKLHGILLEKGVPLIVCIHNPVSREVIYQLLVGQNADELDINGYTVAGVEQKMTAIGFSEIAKCSVKRQCETIEDNVFLQKGNLVCNYLDWLNEYVRADLDAEYVIEAYQAIEKKTEEVYTEETPFLSIVTRTQGKRVEALRETLLSLSGQSCMDFECLIMGHNLNEEEKINIKMVIDEAPDYLKKKIRFIPVNGGNRSTPINEGFLAAHGSYGVVLDDDDLVYDNWVSSFKEKAELYPGSVLHAYVIAQDWCTLYEKNGKEVLRACGAPQNQFCKDFHLLKELHGNYCPILGLAFPLFVFRKLGFKFNESLDTTEDWDYLMRVACLCGVVDIQEPTSMYRLWKNAENSHSLHNKKEWDDNRKFIQNGLKKRPLVLSSQYVSEIMQLIEKKPELFENQKMKKSEVTALYFDNGNGYNEDCVKRCGSNVNLPYIQYSFMGFENAGEITSIRWDPSEFGNLYIENLNIKIVAMNGKVYNKGIHSVSSNGFKDGKRIFFFHPDPQVIVRFKKGIEISQIIVDAVFSKNITEEMHNHLSMKYDVNVVQKTKKAIKYVGKKIIKK